MEKILFRGVTLSLIIGLLLYSTALGYILRSSLFFDLEEKSMEKIIAEREDYKETNVCLSLQALFPITVYHHLLINAEVKAFPFRLIFLTKHFLTHSPPLFTLYLSDYTIAA